MIEIASPELKELRPRISVIGVGGAGGNAVASMIADGAAGVDFIIANTDAQALNGAHPDLRVQLGRGATQGLGAGSVAAVGRAAAEESIGAIEAALDGAHMCFIAAGMGGGTGSGAAPVIARAARDKGILTVGVVTTPFGFEGTRRARVAAAGIEALQQHVDTLIVIPNQNLFRVANRDTTFRQAFALANDVLQQGVRGITDLMVLPGLVNLDFADVRSVMRGMGKAMMGTGEASGANRALDAAELAICNPLLDGAIAGARGLIVAITGGADMRLMEVDEAVSHIKAQIDPEADIIWGSAINPVFEGRLRVSIIATGLGPETMSARPVAAAQPPVTAPLAVPFILPKPVLVDLFEPAVIDQPEAALCDPAPDPEPAPSHLGPSLFERVAGLVRSSASPERFRQPPPMSEFRDPRVYVRRGPGYRDPAALPELAVASG